jgi:hypothetical protein
MILVNGVPKVGSTTSRNNDLYMYYFGRSRNEGFYTYHSVLDSTKN